MSTQTWPRKRPKSVERTSPRLTAVLAAIFASHTGIPQAWSLIAAGWIVNVRRKPGGSWIIMAG
jgi:hypothetical protein